MEKSYANEFVGKYFADNINCSQSPEHNGGGGYMKGVGWELRGEAGMVI